MKKDREATFWVHHSTLRRMRWEELLGEGQMLNHAKKQVERALFFSSGNRDHQKF